MSEAILPSNERFPPSQLLQPRNLEPDTLERTVTAPIHFSFLSRIFRRIILLLIVVVVVF